MPGVQPPGLFFVVGTQCRPTASCQGCTRCTSLWAPGVRPGVRGTHAPANQAVPCAQVLNALEHRNDNPSAIPSRELAKLIYGPGSVYARDPTPQQVPGRAALHCAALRCAALPPPCLPPAERPCPPYAHALHARAPHPHPSHPTHTFIPPSPPHTRGPCAQISSITVDDVRAFLAKWQRPDAAVLGIVGDFDPRQMQQLVESSLGGWSPPPGEPSPPALPSPPLPDQGPISGRIFLVDIPGATQTSVALGEPGERRGREWGVGGGGAGWRRPSVCSCDLLADAWRASLRSGAWLGLVRAGHAWCQHAKIAGGQQRACRAHGAGAAQAQARWIALLACGTLGIHWTWIAALAAVAGPLEHLLVCGPLAAFRLALVFWTWAGSVPQVSR